ncbi:DUF2272 domain-containing protein [bacterium]|nr:DUF2272 domain-containing protein [bacterium]
MKRCWIVLLFLQATLVWAEPHTDRMLQLARQEWEFFGSQTIGKDGKVSHAGHTEAEEGYWQRVGVYWRNGLFLPWTGKNTDEAWSAAFISYLMREAGLGNTFQYSDWHAHYINQAIDGRAADDKELSFWGYRLSERAPQVGDLVCYRRQDDVNFTRRPETYKSHCDLVVAVRPGEIDVIGGNVQDSVTLKTLATNSHGKLIDKNQQWFAVLANRLVNPR